MKRNMLVALAFTTLVTPLWLAPTAFGSSAPAGLVINYLGVRAVRLTLPDGAEFAFR